MKPDRHSLRPWPVPRVRRARARIFAGAAMLFAVGWMVWAGAGKASGAGLTVLTNVQQVLDFGQSSGVVPRHPVRLQGVILHARGWLGTWIVIHDGEHGCALRTVNGALEPEVGQRVEVEGELVVDDFFPHIAKARWTPLGTTPLPLPQPGQASLLATGAQHAGWVTLKATVLDVARADRKPVYLLSSERLSFSAFVEEPVDRLPLERLGATVELQCVPWAIARDLSTKPARFDVYLASNSWIRVIAPGSSNLWSGPRRTVKEFVQAPPSDERLVVSGVVTYANPAKTLILEDATGRAFVTLMNPITLSVRDTEYVSRTLMPELHPGDRVEVVGTKLRERPLAPLIDWAEVRLVERGQPPPAPLLTETDILTGRHDCQRVRLRGRVLDFDRYPQGDTKVSRLIIQTGKQSAHAVFVGNEFIEFEAQPGNEVELTCVPVVSKGNTQLVRGFTMYLHDPSHVRVLPDPPAWRHPVIARVAGASAGMVGLALGWVWLLRRQVSKRTAALRESETRYRALFEHTGAAVVVTGESGELLFINSAALRLLGGDSPEAWRGKSPLNPAPSRAGAGTRRDPTRTTHPPTNHALPDGHASFESTARRLDGSEIPVEVLLTPMTIDGRRVFQAIVTDITQRKKAESSLRQALDREKELGNLKTSFVSMVSHEFRNPLEVILSSTEILERYLDRLTPEERSKHLASVQSSVKRMAAMMQEVLVVGSLEAGRLQARPDDLHLAAWCRRFVDEMRSATGDHGVIELEMADFDPMVQADERLLRHILGNLISNAVKYSPAGSTVRVRVDREGRDAVFRIEDHGRGIPAPDQARLFSAFHRGHNVGQVPGTGLGLVIVQRSVDLHGGTIAFTSTEGEGTTFTVRLPVFSEEPAAAADQHSSHLA